MKNLIVEIKNIIRRAYEEGKKISWEKSWKPEMVYGDRDNFHYKIRIFLNEAVHAFGATLYDAEGNILKDVVHQYYTIPGEFSEFQDWLDLLKYLIKIENRNRIK